MRESIKYAKTNAKRRARRVRAKIYGNAIKPRLSLHISNQRMYAQCIDDAQGRTLIAAVDTVISGRVRHVDIKRARVFGKMFAELAQDKGIERIVFDRGSRAYHGRAKAFAEGAREGGLKF